ncbi:Survival motor neuron [Penicillium bovifimosum]|uniref:Survival motor neuron n=1 Tax=Penicillium bovifimosum TaxID=126998 RepID=A0A9W9HE65_9EURO|nr:Survival motor neuron [Penicillium bovifimosum]KAJ5144081.1 Survival motor neuron [Penicillium bovifimosum]
MGKNKKTHLTHAEIWDDAALVQSWDDAVEEYEVSHGTLSARDLQLTWWQLYHSVHAKGENLEEVLKKAEESGTIDDVQVADKPDGTVADDHAVQPKDEDISMNIDEQPSVSSNEPAVESVATSGPGVSTAHASMPHAVMANDETLKNLMMSWYYAGYYTGLHEGQQQASRK